MWLSDWLTRRSGGSEIAEYFLVNFGGRDDSDDDIDVRDYPAASEGDQWVEYADALGRSRSCVKKDLPSLKEQDKEIVREDDEEQEIGQGLRKEDPDMLTEDMRMDILMQNGSRRRWRTWRRTLCTVLM